MIKYIMLNNINIKIENNQFSTSDEENTDSVSSITSFNLLHSDQSSDFEAAKYISDAQKQAILGFKKKMIDDILTRMDEYNYNK